MSHYLILVADEARARLFLSQSNTGALTEINALVNPDARLREQDLISDSHGGNPHDAGKHGDVHMQIAERFSRQVSEALSDAATRYQPERIHVAAAPRFLGMLRKHRANGAMGSITEEMPKDLTRLSAEQIRSHLPEHL